MTVTVNRTDVIKRITDILQENTTEPGEEMVKIGEVMMQVGKELRGFSSSEARAIFGAATALIDVARPGAAGNPKAKL